MEITDADMVSVAQLNSMQTLDLLNCDRFTDTGMLALSPLTTLQTLDLTGCDRVTDAGIIRSLVRALPLLKIEVYEVERL